MGKKKKIGDRIKDTLIDISLIPTNIELDIKSSILANKEIKNREQYEKNRKQDLFTKIEKEYGAGIGDYIYNQFWKPGEKKEEIIKYIDTKYNMFYKFNTITNKTYSLIKYACYHLTHERIPLLEYSTKEKEFINGISAYYGCKPIYKLNQTMEFDYESLRDHVAEFLFSFDDLENFRDEYRIMESIRKEMLVPHEISREIAINICNQILEIYPFIKSEIIAVRQVRFVIESDTIYHPYETLELVHQNGSRSYLYDAKNDIGELVRKENRKYYRITYDYREIATALCIFLPFFKKVIYKKSNNFKNPYEISNELVGKYNLWSDDIGSLPEGIQDTLNNIIKLWKENNFSLLFGNESTALWREKVEILSKKMEQKKEEELKKEIFEAGQKGEKEVNYQLKFLPDIYEIINNHFDSIRLKHEGFEESQEFDHIVVGPQGVFNIETKTLSGKIMISVNGNWTVYCKIKLPKVAKQNWTKLQVQIGHNCKAKYTGSQERCSA